MTTRRSTVTTRRSNQTRRRTDAGRSARALLIAWCTLAAIGCDSNTGPDTNGPVLVRANAAGGTVITTTFNQELDPSTIDASRFRVTAALANGRGANFGSPERASYRGGQTVELVMRNAISGAGLYTVTANDIRNASGVLTDESAVQFDFVP
jgi:hypothetical protein